MPDFAATLRSLFPRGQVFRFLAGSQFRLVIDALAEMPDRIMTYFGSMRDSGVPGLITDDAVLDWENDLALPYDAALSMDQRKDRIAGKIAGQGGQGPDYLQDTLQASGFPVYVFENIPSMEPSARVYVAALDNFQLDEVELAEYTDRIDPRSLGGHLIYGSPIWETFKVYTSALDDGELDDYELGEYSGTRVVEDEYTIPATASRFIFIWILADAAGINHFVDIPAERETDFRRLVESIKPTHTWCIAQVNFV